ncbi:Homocysteine S-methyltransferase [Hymenopellis radicata]|nr:Homocysteine S-methyltransferase [Hymenopellis radicata]
MSSSHPDPIQTLLQTHSVIILDGALATLLEARGCDLNHPLWSAKILASQPELIQRVHRDYFLAGADIAITASYQATTAGLRDAYGFSESQSSDLIQKSVKLAKDARAEVLSEQPRRTLLVAGSVGPYGAYLADGSEYRGDYSLGDAEMRAFHRSRIQALMDSGVDLLACETMPSFAELKALLGLINDEFPATYVWVSFTLRDEHHISDGTSLEDVCRWLGDFPQVAAIGVNCVPQKLMRKVTNKPLLAYPNSGEIYDPELKVWKQGEVVEGGLSEMVKGWIGDGAVLLGGCCRTTPDDIRTICKYR